MRVGQRNDGDLAAPGQAERLRQRGDKLLAGGDRAGAADAYTRYMASPIDDAALRAAQAAIAAEQYGVAHAGLAKILTGRPNDPVAMRMLGQIALRSGNAISAERVFRRGLALTPGFSPLRFELAEALLLLGRVQEALEEAERLLKGDPRHPGYRFIRATALARLGAFDEALAVHETLVRDQPNAPATWVGYGHALRTLRRRDEAIAAFRQAIARRPEHGEAWWNLANLKTGELTTDDITTMRAALASGRANPADAYHLRFALARALEETGAIEASFAEYERANAARLAVLPPNQRTTARSQVERTVALFTPGFAVAREGQGDPSDAPIFILGMPRSGSTLLDQILASHPLIEGTQELSDIPAIARELDRPFGGRPEGELPEVLAGLSPDRLRELGAEYMARTRIKRHTDKPYFLDKQPVNWQHAGLIRLILPNARIIDMRRDAVGCCLSMFRQHFARGAAYTYSIEAVAAEYRAYVKLMDHLGGVFPGRIQQVRLEALVADLEGTLRALLGELDLPFAPECLRFHESDRAVFTPSSEQVRRPINDEGAALVRKFDPYLGGLRAALGDLAG